MSNYQPSIILYSLTLTCIGHTKAFDSENREALWACLARLGCPRKCVNITRQLHECMKECVLYDGENLDRSTSTKAGMCDCTNTVLNILAALTSLAALDRAKDVGIIYRTDGELSTLTKVKATSIVDLQFPYYCAIAAYRISLMLLLMWPHRQRSKDTSYFPSTTTTCSDRSNHLQLR